MYVIFENLAPLENYFENSWKVLRILWFLDRSSLICRLSRCECTCAIASTPSLDVRAHDWALDGAPMAPNQLSHIFIRLVNYFLEITAFLRSYFSGKSQFWSDKISDFLVPKTKRWKFFRIFLIIWCWTILNIRDKLWVKVKNL